jgi:D-glycero-alpha-D-manno-heptose 1-phosphate guanylyltransferase
MRLLVLAGGFGTRLKTAIADVPKALAPVGDVPFLQLQLEHWLSQGLREFTFLLHHQADQIIDFLLAHQGGLLNGCKVDWLIEPVPMDTGGALAHAVQVLNIKDNFLMTNADTWLGGGVRELMQSAAPAMAVINLPDVSRYGQVHFDHSGHVTAFVEKKGQSNIGWINAGLCHLSAGLFNEWNGCPFSLERELFATLVNNHSLTVVPLKTDFIDIGVPDDYHRFCRWVLSGRKYPYATRHLPYP